MTRIFGAGSSSCFAPLVKTKITLILAVCYCRTDIMNKRRAPMLSEKLFQDMVKLKDKDFTGLLPDLITKYLSSHLHGEPAGACRIRSTFRYAGCLLVARPQ